LWYAHLQWLLDFWGVVVVFSGGVWFRALTGVTRMQSAAAAYSAVVPAGNANAIARDDAACWHEEYPTAGTKIMGLCCAVHGQPLAPRGSVSWAEHGRRWLSNTAVCIKAQHCYLFGWRPSVAGANSSVTATRQCRKPSASGEHDGLLLRGAGMLLMVGVSLRQLQLTLQVAAAGCLHS
jgi:hypothetical protein